MSKKKIKRPEKPRTTEPEWEWRRRYRVWDANRKIFLYPENWIEPEQRVPPASRAILRKIEAFICKPARRKSAPVLLTGKNRTGALVAAQTLARDLKKDLYRVDLRAVISKYVGETEKNLGRIFNAAKKSGAILFFDEADALLGKRTRVKDSHDRYAKIEINYLLQRMEEHSGLTIVAARKRTNIDAAFLRRLRFVVRVPPRRKRPFAG
jgi:SpoVK/Ycf46/Vps4 family AAA+-type ATPase